jgi:hypothetical protein
MYFFWRFELHGLHLRFEGGILNRVFTQSGVAIPHLRTNRGGYPYFHANPPQQCVVYTIEDVSGKHLQTSQKVAITNE